MYVTGSGRLLGVSLLMEADEYETLRGSAEVDEDGAELVVAEGPGGDAGTETSNISISNL